MQCATHDLNAQLAPRQLFHCEVCRQPALQAVRVAPRLSRWRPGGGGHVHRVRSRAWRQIPDGLQPSSDDRGPCDPIALPLATSTFGAQSFACWGGGGSFTQCKEASMTQLGEGRLEQKTKKKAALVLLATKNKQSRKTPNSSCQGW